MKTQRAELFKIIREEFLSKKKKVYLYFFGEYEHVAGELRINNRPFIYVDDTIEEMFKKIDKMKILSNLNSQYRVGWENSYKKVRDEIYFGKKLLRLSQATTVIFGPYYNPNRSAQSYNVYTNLYFDLEGIEGIVDVRKLPNLDYKVIDNRRFYTINDIANSLSKHIDSKEGNTKTKDIETDRIDSFPRLRGIEASNFMNFNDLKVDFSRGINLIIGENNVGKTGLFKFLYANIKAYEEYETAKGTSSERSFKERLSIKMQKTFQSDDKIGGVVYKGQGKETYRLESKVIFDMASEGESIIEVSFTDKTRVDIPKVHVSREMYSKDALAKYNVVFIPAKEILSIANAIKVALNYSTEGFDATYEDLLNDIEPLFAKKPKNDELDKIAEKIENKIIDGKIEYDKAKSKYYYINSKGNKYDLTMSAEGIKQLGIIPVLIKTGKISEGTILFLDEPDNNLNPVALKIFVLALFDLARVGVQIFITTHNHLLSQYISLLNEFRNDDIPPSGFFALFKDEDKNDKTSIEIGNDLLDLSHNSILEEHVELHDKEQELINAENK